MQEVIDLPKVFNEHTLECATTEFLLDAAANVEIARYFLQDEEFFNSLNEMQNSPKMDTVITKNLKKLTSRIQGWASFENALADPNGDFSACAIFLKDMSADEHSLGCWLECMLIHENLTSKLSLTPIPSEPLPPPLLLQERHSSVTHTQFITFVRALLGVSAVLAALSWSDSLGGGLCRERALGLLVLWQGVEGYRQVSFFMKLNCHCSCTYTYALDRL